MWIESDGVRRTERQLMNEAVSVLKLADSRNHILDRALRNAIAEARGRTEQSAAIRP